MSVAIPGIASHVVFNAIKIMTAITWATALYAAPLDAQGLIALLATLLAKEKINEEHIVISAESV